MASIGGSYNPDAVPSSGYIPLPAGEYVLEIVETDYDVNAKGNGMVLKCKAQVIEGDYAGRPYYINYTLEHHESDIAQEIGQRDFAGLRRATGVLSPSDSSELHWIPFSVKIGIQEKKIKVEGGGKRGTGGMENVIKQYLFDDEPAEMRKAA